MEGKTNLLKSNEQYPSKAFGSKETMGFETEKVRKEMGNRKRDGDEIWKRIRKECKR